MSKKLICRTCLKKEDSHFCRNITPESDNELTSNILEMLSFCVPELDIHLLRNPVICNTCISLLETSYKFKTQCLKSEEKILQFSERVNSKVDLNSLQSSVQLSEDRNMVLNNNKDAVKVVIESIDLTKNEKKSLIQPKPDDIYSNDSDNFKLDCNGCFGCKYKYRNPAYHKKLYISPFICFNCNKVTKDIESFRKHINIHRKLRRCKLCNKTFRDLHQLLQHLRTHTGSKPFICNICSKSFQQQFMLKQHVRKHIGHSTVKCSYCSKVFSTKYNLKIHIQNVHKKKPICELCGKTFYTKSALIGHLENDKEQCIMQIQVKAEPVDIDPLIKMEPESYENELSNVYEHVMEKDVKPIIFG